MASFQDRLLQEASELSVKIERLEVFVTTDAFQALHKDSRVLLTAQLSIMKAYQAILNARIAQLNIGK